MALTDYRKKRSFSRTREPEGVKSLPEGHRFVVHKHSARRLHYDLRLEMGGVLKSWAVPKGPSLIPLEKRLAVNVEDHPLEYIDFKGEIPDGEYGAGMVEIWDKGKWEILESDPLKAYNEGIIKFNLKGKKLTGMWTLVKMKKEEKQWLLIKDRDEPVSGKAFNPVLPDAVREPMPENLKVQLAFPYEKPPSGDSWIYEIKYDGYRIISFIDHGKVRLVTRNGYDWTDKFKTIAEYCSNLPVKSAVLDGEIIAPGEKGLSSFELLQDAIGDGKDGMLQYMIFDIPYYNGYSLKSSPLGERKKLLERILSGTSESPLIFSDHLAGDGGSIFKNACRLSLEGIIAKDISSSYEGKRSRSWVKVKCVKRQEFVIGGYTMPRGGRDKFGALLLGYYIDGKLLYCGKTGTGFDNKTLNSIHGRLEALETKTSPFFNLKSMDGARWVRPALSAEVSFMNFTSDMLLRHSVFLGLREDKNPEEVVLEKPQGDIFSSPVAGVKITHPDKMIFDGQNITKYDLALYYEKVARLMLPHIAGRPLVLVRCPGSIRDCFFQKHPMEGLSGDIKTYRLNKKTSAKYYIVIDEIKPLITLVQLGVIEFHIMDIAAGNSGKPDRMVFDLDPGPDVKPEVVSAAALNFRELLRDCGLESFVKTTGGKGLHLVVPIAPLVGWDDIKTFSHILSNKFAERWPSILTTVMSKSMRKGKIFIDFFRNTPGASWAAPYTVRARSGASVSMPVNWDELTADLRFDQFSVLNIDERLRFQGKDPWKDIYGLNQKLDTGFIKVPVIRR